MQRTLNQIDSDMTFSRSCARGEITKEGWKIINPVQSTKVAANPSYRFFYFILYLNVRNLCFHGLSWFSVTNGMVLELFSKNVPESLCRGMGTMPPVVTWYVPNFGRLTKLTFRCNFNCKTYLARYDHRYLICEEPSYTMTFYGNKNECNACMTFSTHKQKKHFFECPA